MEAPSQSGLPTLGHITHNSIQESEKANEFKTVYSGYAERYLASGLSPLTQYKYRLNASNDVGTSPWSDVITACTASLPKSCEQLHSAVLKEELKVVAGILEASPHYVDVPNIYGSSPLMCASQLGKTSVVELLLKHGASAEYSNRSGKTSLMEACYHGNMDCAKALVVGGASWLTTDNSGMSALHWAVDGGHIDMITYILDQGVPADWTTSTTMGGWTPLMRTATLTGSAQVAQVLIEHGANLNLLDANGKTPLMMASLGGFRDLAQLLLQHGADLHVKTKHGKNALDFARSFNRQDVIEVLEKAVTLATPTYTGCN